jgi:hypothetical protein
MGVVYLHQVYDAKENIIYYLTVTRCTTPYLHHFTSQFYLFYNSPRNAFLHSKIRGGVTGSVLYIYVLFYTIFSDLLK